MSFVKSYLLEFLSFMARYANVLLLNNLIPSIFGVGITIVMFTSLLPIPVPPFALMVILVFMAAAASTFVRFILAAVFPKEKAYSDRLARVEEIE